MKKTKLFSLLAAILFAGSAMAQTVTYSYTVSDTIAKDTPPQPQPAAPSPLAQTNLRPLTMF